MFHKKFLHFHFASLGKIMGEISFRLERPAGIEPVYTAWEAIVLPLNYGRKNGAPEGAPKGFNVRIRQNQR